MIQEWDCGEEHGVEVVLRTWHPRWTLQNWRMVHARKRGQVCVSCGMALIIGAEVLVPDTAQKNRHHHLCSPCVRAARDPSVGIITLPWPLPTPQRARR